MVRCTKKANCRADIQLSYLLMLQYLEYRQVYSRVIMSELNYHQRDSNRFFFIKLKYVDVREKVLEFIHVDSLDIRKFVVITLVKQFGEIDVNDGNPDPYMHTNI